MQPFNITAPEDIAKEYGGDKQRIAQAAQMGLIDPTSAVMAGMFIDRMRSAAQTEQAPQQTVAQATFAPQGPVKGGYVPQAAQMGAQMPQQMPQQMPPQQPMPQMAEGGLLMLSIPDDDYAVGGLVSFSDGGDQRRAQERALVEVLQSPNTTTEEKRMARIELDRLAKEGNRFDTGTMTEEEAKRISAAKAARALGTLDPYSLMETFTNTQQTGMAPTAQPSPDQGLDPYSLMETFTNTQRPVNPYDPSGRIGFEGNRFDTGTMTEEKAKQISAGRAEEASGLGAIIQGVSEFMPSLGGRNIPGTLASQELLEAQLRQRLDAGQEIPEPTGIEGAPSGLRQITDPAEIERLIASTQAPAAPPPAITTPAAPPPATTTPAAPSSGLRKITDPAEIERLIASTQAPAAPPPATTTPAVTPAAPPVVPEPVPQLAKQDVKSVEDYFKELSSIRPEEKGPYTQELEKMLASRGAALSDAKKEALNMALLQTGLGMLSQAGGQTALQALGTAALPATKVAADAIKEAKKEDRDLLKMGAAIEQAEGKRKDALVDAAVKRHGAERTRDATLEAARINAERETDLSRQIKILSDGAKVADRAMGRELKSNAEYARDALQVIQQQQLDVAKAGATVSAAARVSEGDKKSEADINKEIADRRANLEDSITLEREAKQRGMSKDQLIEEKLKTYEATLRGQTAAPPAQVVPLPANPTPATLKVGTVYQTARGPGRWNGKAFEAVQ
jgi:hypothetical protein